MSKYYFEPSCNITTNNRAQPRYLKQKCSESPKCKIPDMFETQEYWNGNVLVDLATLVARVPLTDLILSPRFACHRTQGTPGKYRCIT